MKIGIMLRHLNQHGGGVLVYTWNLLREMLSIDSPHEFVLIYRDPKMLGTFADARRVQEIAIWAPSSILWDQIAVRHITKREQLDVLFNPKYSIPLGIDCKSVFVCHGLDWYVMPWGSRWIDRLNHRHLIPRYAKEAKAIIAVSNTTKQHVVQYLGVETARITTIYHGVDEIFKKPVSKMELEETRKLYKLPDKFFLYCGQIYPPKNFGRLLRAFSMVGPKLSVPLVVAGSHTWLCEKELALIVDLGLSSWVKQLGWVDRRFLPALYNAATALVLPSLYESFGLPLVEAMSSGCPIVTSDRHGTRELVSDAGILVDPEDINSIADGMNSIVEDVELRQKLRNNGVRRASMFSWSKCASETLRLLESQ